MTADKESTCCLEVAPFNNLTVDLQCITEHPGYAENYLKEYMPMNSWMTTTMLETTKKYSVDV